MIASAVGDTLVINFARMIQTYTKSILVRAANPQAAAHYYFLLCLYQDGLVGGGEFASSKIGKQMQSLCHEWLVDLILETGLIDEFLGGLSMGGDDGARRYGFLDKYLPVIGFHNQEDFKRHIIRPAAEKAERRAVSASQRAEFVSQDSRLDGAPTSSSAEAEMQQNNAILLFNLAEDYDAVLDILSKRVSEGLCQYGLQSAAETVLAVVERRNAPVSGPIYDHDIGQLERLETMAASVLDYYSARTQILSKLSSERKRTLTSLVALTGFFKSVLRVAQDCARSHLDVQMQRQGDGMRLRVGAASNWNTGLSIIEDMGLIPTLPSDAQQIDYSRISTKAEQLRREFTDLVLRHLPDTFLGVETLLLAGWHDASTRSQRSAVDISLKSRQLQSFVSSVSRWYKIPSETRRRLVTMDELMMH